MSMEHRAFAFDWIAFEAELLPLLVHAMEVNDAQALASFIEAHRVELRDPYQGEPLPRDWQSLLEKGDIQELADFALTRYYHPGEDWGLGPAWRTLDESAPAAARAALLGQAIGPEGHPFDPGRMGAYFQDPAEVERSAAVLAEAKAPGLTDFRALLDRCVCERRGLYVTF